ncbi:hypothetical protein Zmor_006632 [Zophobas morio]|uniref:Uncharacterized protein n=1 Tax=Zophobas morio TaxID=2755281 RepID=A0AA38IXV8_9CUCU|nr:hypothetical protein Zmor_006632 [Zophobas morio]
MGAKCDREMYERRWKEGREMKSGRRKNGKIDEIGNKRKECLRKRREWMRCQKKTKDTELSTKKGKEYKQKKKRAKNNDTKSEGKCVEGSMRRSS